MDYRRFRNLNESFVAKEASKGMSFAEALDAFDFEEVEDIEECAEGPIKEKIQLPYNSKLRSMANRATSATMLLQTICTGDLKHLGIGGIALIVNNLIVSVLEAYRFNKLVKKHDTLKQLLAKSPAARRSVYQLIDKVGTQDTAEVLERLEDEVKSHPELLDHPEEFQINIIEESAEGQGLDLSMEDFLEVLVDMRSEDDGTESGKKKFNESGATGSNVFEIVYSGGRSEIVDGNTAEEIIDALEFDGRDDVLQVQLIKGDDDFDTIWTDEEGLFVSWGKLYQILHESRFNESDSMRVKSITRDDLYSVTFDGEQMGGYVGTKAECEKKLAELKKGTDPRIAARLGIKKGADVMVRESARKKKLKESTLYDEDTYQKYVDRALENDCYIYDYIGAALKEVLHKLGLQPDAPNSRQLLHKLVDQAAALYFTGMKPNDMAEKQAVYSCLTAGIKKSLPEFKRLGIPVNKEIFYGIGDFVVDLWLDNEKYGQNNPDGTCNIVRRQEQTEGFRKRKLKEAANSPMTTIRCAIAWYEDDDGYIQNVGVFADKLSLEEVAEVLSEQGMMYVDVYDEYEASVPAAEAARLHPGDVVDIFDVDDEVINDFATSNGLDPEDYKHVGFFEAAGRARTKKA